MGDCPRVQKGMEVLLVLQRKPSQSTKTIHPHEGEVEQTWQKADLTVRGIPDWAQTQKAVEQKAEVGMSYPGGL